MSAHATIDTTVNSCPGDASDGQGTASERLDGMHDLRVIEEVESKNSYAGGGDRGMQGEDAVSGVKEQSPSNSVNRLRL